MALTDKLTNIADAIRGKTGGTDPLTLDGMATAIAGIQTGGGGSSGGESAMYSGSFTPADNLLTVEVNVPGDFTHFVLYATGTVTGLSMKTSAFLMFDLQTPYLYGLASNNSGSALSSVFTVNKYVDNGTHKRFGANNTAIVIYNSNLVSIETSNPSGTCLGYFPTGVNYLWFAW